MVALVGALMAACSCAACCCAAATLVTLLWLGGCSSHTASGVGVAA
jgi:hypothetical protein